MMSAQIHLQSLQEQLTYVGISKHKSLVQFVLYPIHLTSNDAEQRLAVNKNLHAVLLDLFVERSGLLHIFEVVRQATASTIPYSDFNQLWVRLVQ